MKYQSSCHSPLDVVKTNDGWINAVVEVADHIYTFELKLDKDADEALKQIEDHQCYQKY